MKIKMSVWIGLALLFVLTGCINKSTEDVDEFNKPAHYWYKKIAQSITSNNMDKADAYYVSLRSEHMRSSLMPTAIIMLAHAHMNNEKYLLANYYLDEYNKRYGEKNNRDYIDFMKLKASFLGIKDVNRDQKLMIDTVKQAETYIYRYPGSVYAPLVNTLLIRLHMGQYMLNENIAALYARTGKANAAKIYREKNRDSLVKMSDINAPKQGIIGKIFD